MKDRYTLPLLLLVFVVLAAGIVAAGCLLYRSHHDRYQTEAQHNLTTIADLKVGEISTWRNECLGDANLFYKNNAFSALVRRCIERPQDLPLQEELRTWIGHFQASEHYDQVTLLDAACNAWMSVPDAKEPIHSVTLEKSREAMRSGQLTFEDFRRNEDSKSIYLRLFVPILDGSSGTQPLGILVLRIEPNARLYPLIQRWPVPSETAEIMLIRRKGNEAVFLNELRFQKNTALAFRVSLDRTDLPAVRAALGEEGIVDGVDYRGVPVLAFVRAVPDSPWFLAAKMDVWEAYAPMRERLWRMVVFLVVLLFGAAGAVGFVWRQQHVALYREKYEAEHKYRAIIEASADGILMADIETKMLKYPNPALCRMLGYTEQELRRMSVADMLQKDALLNSLAEFERLAHEGNGIAQDIPCLRKDGAAIYVDINTTNATIDGRKCVVGAFRDITERKLAEEKLKDSKALLDSALSAMTDVFYVFDVSGKFLIWNEAFARVTGYSDQDLSAKLPTDFFLGQDVQRISEAVEEIWKDGRTQQEANFVSKDGAQLPYEFTGSILRDGAGNTIGFSGTGRDLSERKRAEDALRESERFAHSTVNALSSHLAILDETGAIVAVNRAWRAFAEANPPLLANVCEGANYLAVCDAAVGSDCEMAQQAAAHIRAIICGQEEEWAIEYPCHSPEDKRWFVTRVTRFSGDGAVYLVVAHENITDRKLAEEQALIFRRFAEASGQGLGMSNLQGHILYWNPKLCRMYDEDNLEDVYKKDFFEYYPPEFQEQFLNEIMPKVMGGGQWVGELTPISAKGKHIPTIENVFLIRDEEGRPLRLAVVITDITERKEMEDDLHKAKDEAQAANRAKSAFLANMSHEIRTPMTAILGYADLLMDPDLSASSRNNYLAVIRRSGEHLLGLINNILDLSKIEAGKISVDMKPCSVVSLLADVASVVRPRAEQRGVSLVVEYATELPKTILTDDARLRQAVVNLAGNAVKFTERGSVRIVASFLSNGCDGQPGVAIEVIDTGIGIREEILPQLFQPFHQGDASVARKFGGTGLGLAISHHIAHLLGGDLTATSVWGQGSTFLLTVPTGSLDGIVMLERPAEIECDAAHNECESTNENLKGIRILLAEDGFDNRELISTVLRKVGAEVETAENGRIAVAKAEGTPFDLILMDMNMPEMDGYEATRLLRDRGYAQPIVALTANAMSGDGEQCLAAGCNQYAAKPIDRLQLIRIIAACVRKETTAEGQTPAPSQDTPVCDNGAIVSQHINDPDIASILETFISRLTGQVEAMRRAHADGQHRELQRLAHQLKGAGGSYGYPSLTEAARVLEDAAKTQDRTTQREALDALAAMSLAIQDGYDTLVPTGRTL